MNSILNGLVDTVPFMKLQFEEVVDNGASESLVGAVKLELACILSGVAVVAPFVLIANRAIVLLDFL